MSGTGTLAVRDLTVSYAGGRTAVHELSLDVDAGQMVALVGESGCGKTSLARALLGLLPGSAEVTGSARLDDTELVGRAEPAWVGVRGPRIAIIPQGAMAGLNPVHRIRTQLVEMVRLHTDRSPGDAAARAAELLDQVRLDRAVLRAYPHELSGGMRQRVAIALALAGEPRVVIADEPTTGLDAVIQEHVLALLSNLRKRTGIGLLVVSHDLPALVAHADRVAVMYAGRLAEVRACGRIASAVHPYTIGLLSATASVDPDASWGTVPGSAPPLTATLTGCRFAPRCPVAVPRCTTEEPELLPHDGALVACHRAHEAVDPSYPTVPRLRADRQGPAPVARVTGVQHTFRARRRSVEALRGVDLEIGPGEILGLVGESGSGKSTLARVMLGLIRPGGGRVQIDGQELTGLRGRALRALQRRIGFVHQDPYGALHPAMTVARLVAEPLAVSRSPRQGRRERVRAALTTAGLPAGTDFLGRFPHQLSGGQRQRVALARALVADPVLLVADEATSMLDVSTRAGIAITLRALATRQRLAVLFVTHDLGEAVQSCDRIVVLRAGAVVETGPPATIARAPAHPYTRELLGSVQR